MKKTMKFNVKSKDWDLCTFYKIYMDGNIKKIKFIGTTNCTASTVDGVYWICTYCDDSCEMPLEEFLMWDVLYQENLLFKRCDNKEIKVEPWECYEQANKWVKADGAGSTYKLIYDLTEYTSCGYYYY